MAWERLTRWWRRRSLRSESGTDTHALQQWAEDREFSFRRHRSGAVQIEGRQGTHPWRLEWGPPQRHYMPGPELRLRADLPISPALHVLVINRALQEHLDRQLYEQCIGDLQTRVDDQTPTEVRWMVMYPLLRGTDLPALGERWAACSNMRRWLQLWLDGAAGQAWQQLPGGADLPVVLSISRNRCTLRVSLPEPEMDQIEPWLRLFESCLRSARRQGQAGCDNGEPDITEPGFFVPSQPDEHQHIDLPQAQGAAPESAAPSRTGAQVAA